MKHWYKLICRKEDLQLKGTLNGGQSFRWTKIGDEEKWIGIFNNKVWVLQQNDNEVMYMVYESEKSANVNKGFEAKNEVFNGMLINYFHLDLNLRDYYKRWSETDPIFAKAAKQFYGIRILKQEVTENIFSFICSSNNNISRITSMVNKLATFYGEKICELDGEIYYSFPDVEALAQSDVEAKLKANGFGYRSKYINESAKFIMQNGGSKWFDDLKKCDYIDAKTCLMKLNGVGAKVADCICLMSLGHLEALPVDTHVYQIAAKFYMPQLSKRKTVTDKIYNEIGNHFRELYGPLAGWAHTILFCADLRKFQEDSLNKCIKK